MKIAIATPDQVGPDWERINTDYLSPLEIRECLFNVLKKEVESGIERRIVTMNLTILSCVGQSLSMPGYDADLIPYENVFFWWAGELHCIADLFNKEWLSLFDFSEVYSRGKIHQKFDS